MSRIGNKVITIPKGVEVKIDNNFATVKGPKGEIKQQFSDELTFSVEGNEVKVVRPSDSKKTQNNPWDSSCITSKHGNRCIRRI